MLLLFPYEFAFELPFSVSWESSFTHQGHVIQKGHVVPLTFFVTYSIRPYIIGCQVTENPGYTFDLERKRSLLFCKTRHSGSAPTAVKALMSMHANFDIIFHVAERQSFVE